MKHRCKKDKNGETAKQGDIKISERKDKKGQPIICVKVTSFDDDAVLSEWEDYEDYLLRVRVGLDLKSHQVHTLQYFVDALNEGKSESTAKIVFDSDIRAINFRFIINSLKQLMGAKSAYTGKETTKIYIKYVRDALKPLESAVKELEGIKEDDYYKE